MLSHIIDVAVSHTGSMMVGVGGCPLCPSSNMDGDRPIPL